MRNSRGLTEMGVFPGSAGGGALSQGGSTFFTCPRFVSGDTMLGPMASMRREGAFVTRAAGEGRLGRPVPAKPPIISGAGVRFCAAVFACGHLSLLPLDIQASPLSSTSGVRSTWSSIPPRANQPHPVQVSLTFIAPTAPYHTGTRVRLPPTPPSLAATWPV